MNGTLIISSIPSIKKISEFESQGSGWSLSDIIELCVNNNKYVCFSGSSYISLPKDIKKKKAIINVDNQDQKCFVWSVLSALLNKRTKKKPIKNPQRVSYYKHMIHELDLTDIVYPVSLDQIKIFEKNNPTISINVYMYEKEKNPDTGEYQKVIVPVRLTKQIKEDHINLLLLYSSEEAFEQKNFVDLIDKNTCNTHYCWIKNLSKLINSDLTKHKSKIYVCDRYLHFFTLKKN